MGKRGIVRSKKAIGSMVFVEVLQLLMVMFVLTGSLFYVQNQLDKAGFYKTFFARDLGIMTTAIYGAPGNVFQFYDITPGDPTEASEYNFSFQLFPTFVLVNEYVGEGVRLEVYHIDAYRLDSVDEFEMLGFDDLCHEGSVVLIEWADKVSEALKDVDRVTINLSHVSENERRIEIKNASPDFFQSLKDRV